MVFFEDVGFWSRDGGQPEDAIGPILAGTSARYKAPVYFPDTVIAACRAFDVQVDRFTLDMAMWSEAQGRIVATGEAHIVAYDYRAKQKAALPGPVKARLQPGG
jgi:acyl-CoA thioester hydrolase